MQENKIILYQNKDGDVNVDVTFRDDSFWMTQNSMANLFGVNKSTISRHLTNIFSDNELDEHSVVAKNATTANDGKNYTTAFYNLDAIIAVGYRVNSKKATQFRIWATKTLKEFIVKGFVLNDDMLKNGRPFGQDYFDELLERIREIRASERRFYKKITDIYAECSYDYDKDAEITRTFFQTVQNKLLFAVTGSTAPELISDRVDSAKANLGLNTWKGYPNKKILKSDIKISKNYLHENELDELNTIVNMYLDYAESQAKRNKLMSMIDWRKKLDAFLAFNEYDILKDAGKIKRKVADAVAIREYEKYRVIQDESYESDFDQVVKDKLK